MNDTSWDNLDTHHKRDVILPTSHHVNEHLALALLLDFLPHQQAQRLQLRFAHEVIDRLPKGHSPLFLSRREIMSWVNATKQ